MEYPKHTSNAFIVTLVVFAVAQFAACGKDKTPVGENLLVNASFEQVADGVPKNWKINNFRGLEDMKSAVYGVDDTLSYDGERSFFFKADHDTRRFYMLSQKVELKGAAKVRVKARVKTIGVEKQHGQYPQANIALTYYNESGGRFVSARFADVRTEVMSGTSDGWVRVDEVRRLPVNTAYIVIHCVLGMKGAIWFDDLSLEVPVELEWQHVQGEVFTHYWLPERGYPEGSIEYQQQLYDHYAARLGIPREKQERISYYLYPDTALIRETVGAAGDSYVDYRRRQIHSVNPVDNHEIVHLLTEPYGTLPKMLTEGTAFYFINEFNGEPIQPLAQRLLLSDQLPAMEMVLHPFATRNIDVTRLVAASASFVGYVLEFGGSQRFLELHRRLSRDTNFEGVETAFEQVYGRSLADAEAMWRQVLASADFSKGEDKESQE